MKRRMLLMMALACSMSIQAAGPVNGGSVPMPPTFSLDADRDKILEKYPLGVITREAAFAHHGQAHRIVTLPNGLEGWVYELSPRSTETFVLPSGKKQEMAALAHTDIHASYTLVFDDRGVVIDILYRAPGREGADSALLVQRHTKPDVEKDAGRSRHLGTE